MFSETLSMICPFQAGGSLDAISIRPVALLISANLIVNFGAVAGYALGMDNAADENWQVWVSLFPVD